MIEKLKITKWVYWISIGILVNAIISFISYLIDPYYKPLWISHGIVIYGSIVSVILIILLIIDRIFNPHSDFKRQLFSFIVNLSTIYLAYYYLYQMYDSLLG